MVGAVDKLKSMHKRVDKRDKVLYNINSTCDDYIIQEDS